jgi:hypothetical protein
MRSAVAVCAVIAIAFGAVLLSRHSRPPAAARPAAARAGITEEFSGPTLDTAHWAAYDAKRDNGSAWSPSMVRVDGGELQIAGTGRSPTGAGNLAGGVCWCQGDAPVDRYGIWEVRAKFDVGTGYGVVMGLYPAADESTPGWAYLTMARLDQSARTSLYPVLGDADDTVAGDPVSGDYTTWNTYAVEWRRDFATVSLNGKVIFDTRRSAPRARIPSTPMYLYVQLVPGPDGPVPAPNQDTPTQVVAHVDWVKHSP